MLVTAACDKPAFELVSAVLAVENVVVVVQQLGVRVELGGRVGLFLMLRRFKGLFADYRLVKALVQRVAVGLGFPAYLATV